MKVKSGGHYRIMKIKNERKGRKCGKNLNKYRERMMLVLVRDTEVHAWGRRGRQGSVRGMEPCWLSKNRGT